MEKKQYVTPQIEVVKIEKPQLLSGSGVRGASASSSPSSLFDDMGYGGMDGTGTVIPQ